MSNGSKVSFWRFITQSGVNEIDIPAIQRDYVQGRRDEKIEFTLNRLLNDISNALDTMEILDLNYVYGKLDNKKFIPIDGQQRLTLLLLLHIYAFAAEGKSAELKRLHCFKYNTRETTRRFLTQLIDHLPEYFEKGNDKLSSFIMDTAWFVSSWERDPSVASFLVVLEKIDNLFKNNTIADKLMADDCPITYMGLSINDMGNENDLYIKMNARGKPLTEFEIFKSDLFDYAESLVKPEHNNIFSMEFCEQFELQADTEWMTLIWNMCSCSEACGNPADRCDDYYLKLLHQLILNYILPAQSSANRKTDAKIEKVLNNSDFYNFHNYREIFEDKTLNVSGAGSIRKIESTFNFMLWLYKSNRDRLKNLFDTVFDKAVKSERKERVILYAVTAYAVVMEQYDLRSFDRWINIITKLVRNTEIDTDEKFCNSCNAVEAIARDCCKDTVGYFAAVPTIKFFDGYQVSEEILKAKLIKCCSDWEPTLKQAEGDTYFDGQIGFALRLQGINNDSLPLDETAHKDAVQIFEKNWETIQQLLNKNMIAEKDDLLKRALLTFGDYSILANSSYTFFFEGGNQYFTWRRLLREQKSFDVFKMFFNEYQKSGVSIGVQTEKWLNDCIDAYQRQTDFDFHGLHDGTGELLYNLVHISGLFEYMWKNRFNIDMGKRKRVILYQRERLSAEYVEAMSYALYCRLKDNGLDVEYNCGRGYLTEDSSRTFLKKVNGNDVDIEYHDGQFYDNSLPLKDDDKPVKTVEDAFKLLNDQLFDKQVSKSL